MNEDEQVEEITVLGPNWSFSMADMIGIGFSIMGAVLTTVGQGFQMWGREFMASANYGRDKKIERRHQRATRREIENLRKMYEANPLAIEEES